MFIVKLWEDCWIAPWTGDPGRTTVFESAKQFKTKKSANLAVSGALKYKIYRPLMVPEVVPASN